MAATSNAERLAGLLRDVGDAVRAKTGADGAMSLEEMASAIEAGGEGGYLDAVRDMLLGELGGDLGAGLWARDPDDPPSSVRPYALYGQGNVESVELPDTVEKIGAFAFSECGITRMELPDGVSAIGDGAFDNCTDLAIVNVPAGLESIPLAMFAGCASLHEIDLSAAPALAEIGERAFARSGIRTIAVPDGVSAMGEGVFLNCASLRSASIGDGLTELPDSAFFGCSSLDEVQVPEGLCGVGAGAFHGCRSLPSLSFLEGAELGGVGDSAFEGCTSLASVSWPWQIDVPWYAFRNCTALEEVDLSGAGNVSHQAFLGCTSLSSVTLGPEVADVESEAFAATSITSLTVLRENPPSLGEGAISIEDGGAIWVPDGSVDAYKAAEGWSAYAEHIRPLSEKEG